MTPGRVEADAVIRIRISCGGRVDADLGSAAAAASRSATFGHSSTVVFSITQLQQQSLSSSFLLIASSTASSARIRPHRSRQNPSLLRPASHPPTHPDTMTTPMPVEEQPQGTTYLQHGWEKCKKQPMVPIGVAATTFALLGATASLRSGNRRQFQHFLRLRVA